MLWTYNWFRANTIKVMQCERSSHNQCRQSPAKLARVPLVEQHHGNQFIAIGSLSSGPKGAKRQRRKKYRLPVAACKYNN